MINALFGITLGIFFVALQALGVAREFKKLVIWLICFLPVLLVFYLLSVFSPGR